MRSPSWFVVACGIAGCGGAKALPAATSVTPPPAAGGDASNGGITGAAPGATREATLGGAAAFAPDEIWIQRRLTIGRARSEAELVVSTLSFDRAHASLAIETRTAPFGGDHRDAADLAWQTKASRRYEGGVTVGPRGVALRLADVATHEPLVLACERVTRQVAPPTATRVPDPTFHSECGNSGAWSTSATVRLDELACGTADLANDFAPAPGVENLRISADCWQQGMGDRAIAADGSIAPTGALGH